MNAAMVMGSIRWETRVVGWYGNCPDGGFCLAMGTTANQVRGQNAPSAGRQTYSVLGRSRRSVVAWTPSGGDMSLE